MALGALAIASGLYAAPLHAPAGALSAIVVGAVLIAVSGLKLVVLRRWEERLEIVCGLWLMVSPVVLVYGGMLKAMHVVLGLLVCALGVFELWQERDRAAAG
jgi:hypothetical protein